MKRAMNSTVGSDYDGYEWTMERDLRGDEEGLEGAMEMVSRAQ